MAVQNPLAGSSPDLTRASLGSLIRGSVPLQGLQAYADTAGVRAQSVVVSHAGTVDNAAAYSLRFVSTTEGLPLDVTVSFTTASTSGAALDAGLKAAILAESSLGLLVTGVTVGTNEITIAFADGRSATVTAPSNSTTTADLTVTSTAAGWTQYSWGEAAEIVALSPLLSTQYDQGIRPPVLPTLGTAVITLTTNTNSQTYTAVYLHTYADGQAAHSDKLVVSSAASAALTTAAIVAAAEALWPTASVAITTADSVVTVTFPAGEAVAVISEANTSTLAIATATTEAGDLPVLGLVVRTEDEEPLPVRLGVTSLTGPQQGTAPLVARGTGAQWAVTAPGTSFAGSRVYVDTSGVLYDAPSVARIPWPEARWVAGSISGTLAALEV
jgi:hypothetical protein